MISLFAKEKKVKELEKKVEKFDKAHNIQKNRTYKKISHIWFFIISILF